MPVKIKERVIGAIDDLTIMDDYMASKIFEDKKVLSAFLSIILKQEIHIVRCIIQVEERPRRNAHYVTYDVLAFDDHGNIYNIEIQDYGEKDLILRLTYHAGILITKALRKGQKYRNLKKQLLLPYAPVIRLALEKHCMIHLFRLRLIRTGRWIYVQES